jgi:Reverse transcriptase (RNA-dependent DNA polymerase)
MANKFNNFFSNVAQDIISSIPPVNIPYDKNLVRHNNGSLFEFVKDPLTKSEIAEAIDALKSKDTADSNGLSSNFIKKIALTISNPLYIIFCKSFQTGQIPTQLKVAKIVPLFKNGDQFNGDNYRPIALLDTFSKILEKIVCLRLSTFLESNDRINKYQFGFRKEHSTVHPMMHFINHISSSLEKKEHTVAAVIVAVYS